MYGFKKSRRNPEEIQQNTTFGLNVWVQRNPEELQRNPAKQEIQAECMLNKSRRNPEEIQTRNPEEIQLHPGSSAGLFTYNAHTYAENETAIPMGKTKISHGPPKNSL